MYFFLRKLLAKGNKWSNILSETNQKIGLLPSPRLASPLLPSPPVSSNVCFKKNGESQDNEIAKGWLCWEPRGP